jgi:hypothetical protein
MWICGQIPSHNGRDTLSASNSPAYDFKPCSVSSRIYQTRRPGSGWRGGGRSRAGRRSETVHSESNGFRLNPKFTVGVGGALVRRSRGSGFGT